MTALFQSMSRLPIAANVGTETLKWVALVCGAGVFVALFAVILRATYGLDLSPGLF